MNHRFFGNIVLTFLIVSLLGGCFGGRSAKTHFYLLGESTGSAPFQQNNAATGEKIIGVGPVEVAEYLDRPQIVTRSGQNEIHFAEYDRWAEPIKDGFARVMAANLSNLLGTEQVAPFPWRSSTILDYQVTIKVVRFDGEPGGSTSLVALWSLYGRENREILKWNKFTGTEICEKKDFESLVAAKNRLIEKFSAEVAGVIRSDAASLP
ncbi:PqiC family protein [Desulforhabdus amnigena]|jgi:uncharacterized lipoprotein YmbA|uniref:ABC-type transport auxiliary lipoprotein component domain-containing protein n=1 Tax=Desulforhabdus amnigena TaxID=40218 RepID=A0A9W6D1G0_9BACT|nr:PqiC family protein [Desulforhabdus amnigena]NLJ27241.1 membrane integrity-associated transporter subunit PqiC [Deltaproteobacteria bacterium]GLI32888.1 hypothetical protein DAMNIGENAA_03210 [Desulforhabdus amnigena]